MSVLFSESVTNSDWSFGLRHMPEMARNVAEAPITWNVGVTVALRYRTILLTEFEAKNTHSPVSTFTVVGCKMPA